MNRISKGVITSVVIVVLAAFPAVAQRVRQVSDFTVERLQGYALVDAGDTAFFASDADPLGANPDHRTQVFRRALPAGLLEQVTALSERVLSFSVSDDGTALLVTSEADPLGSNADGGEELFLIPTNGGSLVQLTNHSSPDAEIDGIISGDGLRVVFQSDADLTGLNPLLVSQLFVIQSDGTLLTQLTQATTSGSTFLGAISDVGDRFIFVDNRDLTGANADGSFELFRMMTTGAGLAQVTLDVSLAGVDLSGNGQRIVFGDLNSGQIFQTKFNGSVPAAIASGQFPSVTDDSLSVYYSAGDSVLEVGILGGTPTTIWLMGSLTHPPALAGSGNRLLFGLKGPGAPFIADPDSLQLLATDGAGGASESVFELGEQGRVEAFEMTADGSRIVFPWGDSTFYDRVDLFMADTAGGSVTPLTDRAESINPDISDDGETVVFSSAADLLPGACGQMKIYRIDGDGTGLQQIAPSCPGGTTFADHPVISADGNTVVLQALGNLSGTDTGGGAELYGVDPSGGPVWSVTNDDDGQFKNPRIDGTGVWSVYHSPSDVTGQNPTGDNQVFRARVDGSLLEQLTTFGASRPDISSDGSKVVFYSDADPLGLNPENNHEIFLRDTALSVLQQLTQTAVGENRLPRISPNGQFVAFESDSPWFDSARPRQLFRLDVSSGTVEMASAGIGQVSSSLRQNLPIDIDDQGNVAFYGSGDLTGLNPDLSRELWLAEFNVAPRFEISAPGPTVLVWDPAPWALGYDVIRGSLDQLADGAGATVDLGSVVCIENDSSDARTVGDEDAVDPLPGQGFFFLYRGTRGDLDGPGSWGTGSSGDERTPLGGSCPN